MKFSRAAISAAALTFALLVTLTGCGGTELSESTTQDPTQEGTYALATCGNGKLEEDEQCDDGNTTDGDGCSSTCTLEARANCGNGTLDDFEQCDDGNTTDGDGCSAICTIQGGYSCPASPASPSGPSVCAPRCGDGIKDTSEACDDGNTTDGDGCNATCTAVESSFGCKNTGASAFITRRGRTECLTRSNLGAPPGLPETAIQPDLSVPGRYRIQYVSGAISFSNNKNWRPGIMGVNYFTPAGEQAFSVGYTEGFDTREQALALAVNPGARTRVERDFEALTGDVRVTFIDNDCDLLNNTDNTITYRVDAMSICQLIPVVTDPPAGGITDPVLGGTASPGATVKVYIDGSTSPACEAVADSSGNWTCTISGYEEGEHSITKVTSTTLSATEESTPGIDFSLDNNPPAPPVITGPTPGSVLDTSTPVISGTAEANSTVTVREGDTVICTATTDASGAWSCTPTTPLSEGPHTVTATATDVAGNTSQPSNDDPFTISIPPDTTITKGPGESTENTTAEFEYASNESNVTYECSLDGQDFAPCETSYTVARGQHTLRVRAVDAAGNVDPTPAEYTWTVTEPAPGEPPVFAGNGCSAAPVSSWLALLGLLGLRRRSRR
ncbi:myxococcus cysteine-rich repeat containing protein [Archangium violaceum]|uniref:myxococcus cysteine-rich repeat containing protein n=1 Tax=Archangium violaceum TaxID=83451 RepID=UPI001EF15B43|nr:myxococcus cysteine-rich repeat containing protein [Archangium violaceum]